MSRPIMAPGISAYNYYGEIKRKQAAAVSGQNLTLVPQSNLSKLCIQNFDTSVTVGGSGGLPVNPGEIAQYMLGGNFYPAPTFGTVTMNTYSNNAIACEIKANVIFTNVPQDGFVQRVLWLFRQNGGTGNWTAWAETPLGGLPTPPTSQTLSFTYGGVANGMIYDFAACYISTSGEVGTVGIFESAYTANAVQLPAWQQLGTLVTPSVTSILFTPVASINGITATVEVQFTVTNQPTDGSLSRISLFFAIHGQSAAFYCSIPAVGVGSPTPPASGSYTIYVTDLALGQQYDFGITLENTQGEEGGSTGLGTSAVTTLTLPQQVASTQSLATTSFAFVGSGFSGFLVISTFTGGFTSIGLTLPAGGNWQIIASWQVTGYNTGAKIDFVGSPSYTSKQVVPVYIGATTANGDSSISVQFQAEVAGGQTIIVAPYAYSPSVSATWGVDPGAMTLTCTKL